MALLFKQNVKNPRTAKPSKRTYQRDCNFTEFWYIRYLGQEKIGISNKPFIDATFMSQSLFEFVFLVQVMYAVYC